ncbi:MAG: hypothetical protein ACTHN4_03740 [Sphingomicrobium sp.]
MKAFKTAAMGGIGIAALVAASAPAEAQYYGGNPYGYGQYGYSTNVIGQVLQSILNPYGQFGYGGYGAANPQVAVNQCTAAVQQRLSYQYRPGGYAYGGYSPYGYTNAYSNARILGITSVQQRSATTLRVRGYASSGMAYNGYSPYGYGAYGSVGYGYAQPADLSFKCDVDYRGYIRDLDINRRY